MSDNWLIVIPDDPDWMATDEQLAAAVGEFAELVPRAREIEAKRYPAGVQVIDSGSNTESITCPRCHASLGWAWFGPELDARYANGAVTNLDATTPCCRAEVSLNDLEFDMPMGFARLEISALYPDRLWLGADERARIEDALGHGVRQIFRHL